MKMKLLNNQQILEKAVFIAESRGLKHEYILSLLMKSNYHLIFNHDFAKSIWGVEPRDQNHPDYLPGAVTIKGLPEYQYHLQMMVIAEDPIKYLEANI
jgi:hypothetical protein